MAKPICGTLMVLLCVCLSLLIHSSDRLPETMAQPELQMSGARFGGLYRQVLHNNPSTRDPALMTDAYGGALVRQIFDSFVQFDAHLKPFPTIAKFWEASQDGRTWTSPCAGGARFIMPALSLLRTAWQRARREL